MNTGVWFDFFFLCNHYNLKKKPLETKPQYWDNTEGLFQVSSSFPAPKWQRRRHWEKNIETLCQYMSFVSTIGSSWSLAFSVKNESIRWMWFGLLVFAMHVVTNYQKRKGDYNHVHLEEMRVERSHRKIDEKPQRKLAKWARNDRNRPKLSNHP